MADFSFFTGRLATGAAVNDEADVVSLIQGGVTHVIDCRSEFDDAPLFVAHPEIHYLWNGTNDDGQRKPPEWFQKSIEFALDALSKPYTKVYAHCAAGINRGPSTAYAILLATGLDSTTAEGLIRARRPQVGLAYKADAQAAVEVLGYADFPATPS